MPVEELVDHSAAGAQLAGGDAGDERLGQRLRIEALQVVPDGRAEIVAEPAVIQGRADRGLAGGRVLERVLQQFGDVEHLDAVVAEDLRERVVLLLGAGHPGQPVEQEAAAAAGRDTFQLGARTVNEYGAQPAGLTVRAMGVTHDSPRPSPAPPRTDDPSEGVSPLPWPITHPQSMITRRVHCAVAASRAVEAAARTIRRGRPARHAVHARPSAAPSAAPGRPAAAAPAGTTAPRSGSAVPRGGQDRPHGGAPLVRAYPPAGAQMLHDAQATAADRGQ